MWKLAVQNLRRNRWRTALTAAGIALAVALLVWTQGWIDAFSRQMVHAATAIESGHVRIVTPDYADRASLFEALAEGWQPPTTPGVVAWTPRVRAGGLVGNESRSQVARLIGVDPVAERRVSSVADGVTDGRWLAEAPAEIQGPREAVVGAHLARQLDVDVGDELVVFAQAADGSLGNDALEVVGLLVTGNEAIDRGGVFLHIDDLRYTVALDDRTHEWIARVDDLTRAAAIADGMGLGDGAVAQSWDEVNPTFSRMIEQQEGSMGVLYLILYAIAALGLINAQRMSALERRREFGVLIAIGLAPSRVARLVVGETVLLASMGAAAGAALGLAINSVFAVRGLDLAAMASSGDDFSMMGVAFREPLYFRVDALGAVEPVLVMLLVAAFCGWIPARRARRTPVVEAISGRS